MILTKRSFREPPSLGRKLVVLPADAGGSTSRMVDRRYKGVERGKLQTVAGIHGGYIGMTCVPCTDAANRGSAEEAHTPAALHQKSLPSGFQTGVCCEGANQPTPISHYVPGTAKFGPSGVQTAPVQFNSDWALGASACPVSVV